METRKKRKVALVALAAILFIAGAWKVISFFPWGMPEANGYFKPLGERKLQGDEIGQWAYVRHLYHNLDATGDSFPGWDDSKAHYWKYAIAFLAYGMPSLALIDPDNKDNVIYNMQIMIRKMKSKKVWKDWMGFGFGDDPITKHNIMYKGHLNLMYGLYQLMSGDTQFAKEYTWLTQQIVKEIRVNHQEGKYEGTTCEPDQFFVQCNSIGLLSLWIYDKLYGTTYRDNEVQWVLDFIRKKMVDPKAGVNWQLYHPSCGCAERFPSGYANAWAMTVLHPLDPKFYDQMYPVWKKIFVKEILGTYAYVREVPGGGPSPLATQFGLWAAKEFGDKDLFRKLRNAIEKQGKAKLDAQYNLLFYEKIDNTLANGPLLAFKLHVGWNTLLNANWGYKLPYRVPDVSKMTWKDILPQETHEMSIKPL